MCAFVCVKERERQRVRSEIENQREKVCVCVRMRGTANKSGKVQANRYENIIECNKIS